MIPLSDISLTRIPGTRKRSNFPNGTGNTKSDPVVGKREHLGLLSALDRLKLARRDCLDIEVAP